MIQRITSGIHKSINQEMFSALMNSSQKNIIELRYMGKFINATDIEPSYVASTMKGYFTICTNILTLIIYSVILLLTAFIPTSIGVITLFLLVFFTGSRFAVTTKKISESNIALRAKYRELITERFLGWETITIFNSLTNEEKIKKYLTNDLQQYRRSSADSRDNSINFCFNTSLF